MKKRKTFSVRVYIFIYLDLLDLYIQHIFSHAQTQHKQTRSIISQLQNGTASPCLVDLSLLRYLHYLVNFQPTVEPIMISIIDLTRLVNIGP